MKTFSCINFDGLPTEELKELQESSFLASVQKRYVKLLIFARIRRENGDIQSALSLEKEMDNIYNSMPENLVW